MTRGLLSGRERSIFACFTDAVVAPAPPLPPVARTDAVAAYEASLARAPAVNRLGLRAALLALELGPRALGFGARMRRLAPDARAAYLDRLAHAAPAAGLLKALRGLAHLHYYGDLEVLRLLGYDPAAVVARAAEARHAHRSRAAEAAHP